MYCTELRMSLLTILVAEALLIGFAAGGEYSQCIVFVIGICVTLFLVTYRFSSLMMKQRSRFVMVPATVMEKLVSVFLFMLGALFAFIILYIIMNTVYNLLFYSYNQWYQPDHDSIEWSISFFKSNLFVLNPFRWFYEILFVGHASSLSAKISSYLIFYLLFFALSIAVILWGCGNRMLSYYISMVILIYTVMPKIWRKYVVDIPSGIGEVIHGEEIRTIYQITTSVPPYSDYLIFAAALCLLAVAYFGLKEQEMK